MGAANARRALLVGACARRGPSLLLGHACPTFLSVCVPILGLLPAVLPRASFSASFLVTSWLYFCPFVLPMFFFFFLMVWF